MSDLASPRSRLAAPVVPIGGRFVGLLAFRAAAVVQGEVIGPIVGSGHLEVEATSVVVGDVTVDDLRCAGRIEGEVSVRDVARIDEGATLRGTLGAARVSVANGAWIQGRCSIGARSR